jgi:hypothetical protein
MIVRFPQRFAESSVPPISSKREAMTPSPELAIHEAGHLVAADNFEVDFTIASLYRTEDSAAHVELSPSVDQNIRAAWGKKDAKSRATIAAAAITYMAGAMAVRQAAGDTGDGMAWDIYGASGDYEAAWALMPSTGVSWDWLKRKTKVFVALNYPEILHLARELQERRIMTSGQIRTAIEGGRDDRHTW